MLHALAARGAGVGDSLFEDDMVDTCRALLDEHGDRLVLPSDITALGPGGELTNPAAGGDVRQVGTSVPAGWTGVDIGPGTAADFGDRIAEARTVFWNGPMGVFEDPASRPGPGRGPGRGRHVRVHGGGRGAARRRWPSSGWTARSTTSRPAGAPPWSCSSGATCRAWPTGGRVEGVTMAGRPAAHRVATGR